MGAEYMGAFSPSQQHHLLIMDTARKTWELDNNVELVDAHRDALYTYDTAEQKAINDAKPWKTDPHHFKNVRISAVALLKMVMHARSGGSIEVMGLMQGKIENAVGWYHSHPGYGCWLSG